MLVSAFLHVLSVFLPTSEANPVSDYDYDFGDYSEDNDEDYSEDNDGDYVWNDDPYDVPTDSGDWQNGLFKNDYLFENDMRVAPEVILSHYNFHSTPYGSQIERKYVEAADTAVSDTFKGLGPFKIGAKAVFSKYIGIWEDKEIPYTISKTVPSRKIKYIKNAIKIWEKYTCIRFVPYRHQDDYVVFVNEHGCWSSVGRIGGKQKVGVGGCSATGYLVHELGHTIGFWHEQSRPDRDKYINVNRTNVHKQMLINFIKQKPNMIDYQGTTYNFGSIMHYHRLTFSKHPRTCKLKKCFVISVKNSREYEKQGSPEIGQRKSLSLPDVLQAQRLYSCPARGVHSNLFVKIVSGTFKPGEYDIGVPNPYIIIQAVDSNGKKYTQQTSRKGETYEPYWNQVFPFGRREWQFFRISAWNTYAKSEEQQMTMSQTIPVTNSGVFLGRKHCASSDCDSYVIFNFHVIEEKKKSSAIVFSSRSIEFAVLYWMLLTCLFF